MHDLTPNEIGVALFKIRSDLEKINSNLTRWRTDGIGPNRMVPMSVIAAESKVASMLNSVEDLIQIIAKISKVDR